MKHLLEALQGRLVVQAAGSDLNDLLTDIRDSKESKNGETFYDTLDKVLAELRSTDQAVAFLKPVKKSEAPDYDSFIKHPMDLQTMQKKVKTHVYKSKQDFASDLHLIWNNCLVYNSDPNHPLRRAAMFMRKKADHILERITDKNERSQAVHVRVPKPPAQHYSKSRTIESSDEDDGGTPLANGRLGHHPNGILTNGINGRMVNGATPATNGTPASVEEESRPTVLGKRRGTRTEDVPFGDRPAIVRTPSGMGSFRDVDIEMQRYLDSEGAGPSRLQNPLMRHDVGHRLQKKLKTVAADDGLTGPSWLPEGMHTPTADKQTRQVDPWADGGDIFANNVPSEEIMDEWWTAVTGPTFLGSAMPPAGGSLETLGQRSRRMKPPRRKNPTKRLVSQGGNLVPQNIATLRKIRKVHSRLTAIQAGEEPRPLSPPGPDVERVYQRSLRETKIPLEGGQAVAKHRTNAMGSILLEHAGFEGASKAALDVLSDVAADFMMNLGRTLRFYTDKYGTTMSGEDILLHTLFENGTLQVQDLERYIKEDIERYGNKISDLERKLTQVYNEFAEPTVLEDDTLFEEEGAFMPAAWSEFVDDDFFGFRAIGIDKELGSKGLEGLSRVMRGPKGRAAANSQATSDEPPPPYPPPPPFLPFTQTALDPPIGLLQSFYRERLEAILSATGHAPEGLPPPSPTGQTLPDESPDHPHTKSGPLGQITQPVPILAKIKAPKAPGPPKGSTKKKSSQEDPPGGPGPSNAAPPAAAPSGSQSAPTAGPSNPVNPPASAPAPAGTPSPVKQRKSKSGKKKASGPASEAPQAGPIVMATA